MNQAMTYDKLYSNTVAVYFGSAGIRKTRYAIPAALIADAACFVSAAFAVRLLMGA